MKIKVSEATAEALDWMVAKCEGVDPDHWCSAVDYSSDWMLGGPIIDREGIGLFCNLTQTEASRFVEAHPDWRAFSYRKHHEHHFGRTALIAAMRCYVASKLGDEVEVPKELTCQPTPSA